MESFEEAGFVVIIQGLDTITFFDRNTEKYYIANLKKRVKNPDGTTTRTWFTGQNHRRLITPTSTMQNILFAKQWTKDHPKTATALKAFLADDLPSEFAEEINDLVNEGHSYPEALAILVATNEDFQTFFLKKLATDSLIGGATGATIGVGLKKFGNLLKKRKALQNSSKALKNFSKITKTGKLGSVEDWPNFGQCSKLLDEALKDPYFKGALKLETLIGGSPHHYLKIGNKYYDPSLSDNIGAIFGKTNIPLGQKWFSEGEYNSIFKEISIWKREHHKINDQVLKEIENFTWKDIGKQK